MVNVALDAMGGDNAPLEVIKGALDALKLNDSIKIYLLGDEEKIKECMDNVAPIF